MAIDELDHLTDNSFMLLGKSNIDCLHAPTDPTNADIQQEQQPRKLTV